MEEFDSNYLAWILYKLFYGIDKEVAKNKERSYVEIDLSNNCKYDVFYNYVKILNLMTLGMRPAFLIQLFKIYKIIHKVLRMHPQQTEL